jgi:hypothetical protein
VTRAGLCGCCCLLSFDFDSLYPLRKVRCPPRGTSCFHGMLTWCDASGSVWVLLLKLLGMLNLIPSPSLQGMSPSQGRSLLSSLKVLHNLCRSACPAQISSCWCCCRQQAVQGLGRAVVFCFHSLREF